MSIDGLYAAVYDWILADAMAYNAAQKDSSYEAMKPFYATGNAAKDKIKKLIKRRVDQWCEAAGFGGSHNRLEIRFVDPYNRWDNKFYTPKIRYGYVSIYSSKGSLGNRVRWLNKITLDSQNNVVTHVAKTDKNYLGNDKPEKFKDFVIDLKQNIQEQVDLVWAR